VSDTRCTGCKGYPSWCIRNLVVCQCTMSSTSMTHCRVAHTGQGHDTSCTMNVAEPRPITAPPGVVHAVARGGAAAGLIILKYLFATIFVCGPYLSRYCSMIVVWPLRKQISISCVVILQLYRKLYLQVRRARKYRTC